MPLTTFPVPRKDPKYSFPNRFGIPDEIFNAIVRQCQIQIDASGGGAPSGPAGGDLSGTYPNPTIPNGTYLPTFTNVLNLTSSTAYDLMYTRIGDIVTVSGVVEIVPTAASTINLRISLPVASALTDFKQLSGVASNSNNITGHITGDATNDAALFVWEATGTSTVQFRVLFTYQVI